MTFMSSTSSRVFVNRTDGCEEIRKLYVNSNFSLPVLGKRSAELSVSGA